jgi:hypothetical protein
MSFYQAFDTEFRAWYDTTEFTRVCKRCGSDYKEKDNMGAWRCQYHPGPYNLQWDGENHEAGHWDCCGRSLDKDDMLHYEMGPAAFGKARGCTACDHTTLDRDYHEQDDLMIPLHYAGVFVLYERSAQVDAKTAQYVIRRYDSETVATRLQTGTGPTAKERRPRPLPRN